MITFRLADESDYQNINNFFNRIYGTNRSLEAFYWEFHHCPHGSAIYVVAEDDGKVIGTNCVIPIDLITADQHIIRSGKSEDTLVDPAYRGQKIFYRIYEFLFEKCREANIQVIWGFTSAKKPFRKAGFSVPYDHKQSIAVHRPFRAYRYLASLNKKNRLIDKVKILGLCILSKSNWLVKSGGKKLPYRLETESKTVDGISELIQSNLDKLPGGYAIHQSSEFEQWRIYQNPHYLTVHTYSLFDDDDRLIALVVFNSHANGLAFVVHSTFHDSLDLDTRVAILRLVSQQLFRQGISLIRNWHFDTNHLNQADIVNFRQSGYTYLDRGIGLVWKVLDDIQIEPENFLLSRVSTEGVH